MNDNGSFPALFHSVVQMHPGDINVGTLHAYFVHTDTHNCVHLLATHRNQVSEIAPPQPYIKFWTTTKNRGLMLVSQTITLSPGTATRVPSYYDHISTTAPACRGAVPWGYFSNVCPEGCLLTFFEAFGHLTSAGEADLWMTNEGPHSVTLTTDHPICVFDEDDSNLYRVLPLTAQPPNGTRPTFTNTTHRRNDEESSFTHTDVFSRGAPEEKLRDPPVRDPERKNFGVTTQGAATPLIDHIHCQVSRISEMQIPAGPLECVGANDRITNTACAPLAAGYTSSRMGDRVPPLVAADDPNGAEVPCKRPLTASSAVHDVRARCLVETGDCPNLTRSERVQGLPPRVPTLPPRTAKDPDILGSNPELFDDDVYGRDQKTKEALLYHSRFTSRPFETPNTGPDPNLDSPPPKPSLSDSVLKELSAYPAPVASPDVPQFLQGRRY
jgi:hypothetical protein